MVVLQKNSNSDGIFTSEGLKCLVVNLVVAIWQKQIKVLRIIVQNVIKPCLGGVKMSNQTLTKGIVTDWIYALPLQTLTDELKEDIVDMFLMYAKECEK